MFFRTSVYKQSCHRRSQPNLIGSWYFIRIIIRQWLYYIFLEWGKASFPCQLTSTRHTSWLHSGLCSHRRVRMGDGASQVHWFRLLLYIPGRNSWSDYSGLCVVRLWEQFLKCLMVKLETTFMYFQWTFDIQQLLIQSERHKGNPTLLLQPVKWTFRKLNGHFQTCLPVHTVWRVREELLVFAAMDGLGIRLNLALPQPLPGTCRECLCSFRTQFLSLFRWLC